jgi:hypothetical protein
MKSSLSHLIRDHDLTILVAVPGINCHFGFSLQICKRALAPALRLGGDGQGHWRGRP